MKVSTATLSNSMIYINRYRILLLLAFGLCLQLSSCKKMTKEAAEKAAKATAKEAVEETSERGLRSMSKKALKKLDWDELFKLIKKENINLANSISRLDGGLQRSLGKALQNDIELLQALLSSNTVLDEYTVFAKQAPKLANDVNFLRMFVKADFNAKRLGRESHLGKFFAKEEGGFIRLIDKESEAVVAKYRDGIVTLAQPFKKATRVIDEESMLNKELIPNSTYIIRSLNGDGMQYLYHVDDLGRVYSVDAKYVSANEVLSNIVNRTNDVNLGKEWETHFKKLKQVSDGYDCDISYKITYSGDDTKPAFVHVEATAKGKKVVSHTYKNIDSGISELAQSAANNTKLVKKYAKRLKIDADKERTLIDMMGKDKELAKLIHENPEFNIKRWLNTRNHVNKLLIKRTPKGRMPINAATYAGNVYYFNPHLNPGLKARLSRGGEKVNLRGMNSLSYDDLIKYDKMYPDGVPFTKEGFPDFSKVAAKDKKGNPISVNIGKLSGDSQTDCNAAEALFQAAGNKYEYGYTWHHVENSTRLLRVPMVIHQLVDHTGGMSMAR